MMNIHAGAAYQEKVAAQRVRMWVGVDQQARQWITQSNQRYNMQRSWHCFSGKVLQ
jgi:hypothetical protein